MAGSVVDSAFASDVGAEGVPVPLRGGQDPTVQFEPPDGIRPAQLGLIIDERVNASDVSATIVDLAVRGYLTIEELREERALFGHRTDWKLTRTARPAGDLLGYERLLLDGLFEEGDVVELDDLKQRFSERYGRVRSAIYDDALQRRWFPAHPDHIRTAGRVAGVLVAALAVAGIVWCVTTNSWGLLLVPVAAGGPRPRRAGRVAPPAEPGRAGRLPARRRLPDLHRALRGTPGRLRRAARAVQRVPPDAVALGAVGLWSQRFAGLSAEQLGVATWWVGAGHFGAGGFDSRGFGAAVGSFSSTVSSSLPATAGSSGGSGVGGGGFSGGGGGGGGGGSW